MKLLSWISILAHALQEMGSSSSVRVEELVMLKVRKAQYCTAAAWHIAG